MKKSIFVKSVATLFTAASLMLPALTGCADIKAKKAELDANAFPELRQNAVVTTESDRTTPGTGSREAVDTMGTKFDYESAYNTLAVDFDVLSGRIDTMKLDLDAAEKRADKAEDRAEQAEAALSKANSDLDAVNTAMAMAMAKAEESEGKLTTEGKANVALRHENADLKEEISSLKATNSNLQSENKSLKDENKVSTAEVRTFKSSIEMMEAAMSEMEAAGCEADPTNPMGWIDWIPMYQESEGVYGAGLLWCNQDALRGEGNYAYAGTYEGYTLHVYSSYDNMDAVYADNEFQVAHKSEWSRDIIVVIGNDHYVVDTTKDGEGHCAVSTGWTSVTGYPMRTAEKHGKLGWFAEFFTGAYVAVPVDGVMHAMILVGNEAQPTINYVAGNTITVQLPDTYEYLEGEHHVVKGEDTYEYIEGEHHVVKGEDTYEYIEGEHHVVKGEDTYEYIEGEHHVVKGEDTYEYIEGEHHVIKGEDTYEYVPGEHHVIETDPQHNTLPDLELPADNIDDTWAPMTEADPAHNTLPNLNLTTTTSVNDTWNASSATSANDEWKASGNDTETEKEVNNSVDDSWVADSVETCTTTTTSDVNDVWESGDIAHNGSNNLDFSLLGGSN